MPVSAEQLRELTALLPAEPKRKYDRSRQNFSGEIDVPEWVSAHLHGIDIVREKAWGGGTVYVLSECPFDASHTAPDSCIIQFPSGAVAFKCLHNSCQQHDWQVLRERFDPKETRHGKQHPQMPYDDVPFGDEPQDSQYYDQEIETWVHTVPDKESGVGRSDISIPDLYTVIEGDSVPIEHIGGVFPRGDITMLFGKSGCGKTIWLDCFTRQLSEGGEIMDGFRKDEPPRKIIFFEADAPLKLFATRKYMYRWNGDDKNLKHVFTRELLKRDIWLDLATDEGYGLIRRVAEEECPDMMIFDTLQGFHTKDENKANEMKPLFMRFVHLATDFNCAVVVIHHARKGGTKFKTERLSDEDAQGSNIFLREAGAVIVLEKLALAEKTKHVFSLKKSWANATKDDWFGFEFKEEGLYQKYMKLAFELFPETGETKTSMLKRAIMNKEGWFSSSDITHAVPNVSQSYVKKVLSEMVEASLLEVDGRGRNTKYKVILAGSLARARVDPDFCRRKDIGIE
jgi:RecA-family ATPase